jgi:hypothetical protein
MHRSGWLICATLAAVSSAKAEGTASKAAVRMSRVEGAAVDVRRTAESVEETAKLISNSKHLSNIPRLRTQLDELNRAVISARMAVDLAREELSTSDSM